MAAERLDIDSKADLVTQESSEEPPSKRPRFEIEEGSSNQTSDFTGDGDVHSLKRSDTVEYDLVGVLESKNGVQEEVKAGSGITGGSTLNGTQEYNLEGKTTEKSNGNDDITKGSQVMDDSTVCGTQEYNLEDVEKNYGTDEVTEGSEVVNHSDPSGTQEYNLEATNRKNDGTNEVSGESGVKDNASITENEQKNIDAQEVTERSATENVITEENTNDLPVVPTLTKIPSVLQDAELIAGIVDGVDADVIYNKLKEHRGNPDRVNLVTNEILEEAGHALTSSSTQQQLGQTPSSFMEDFVSVIDKSMANMSALPLSANEIHQLLLSEGERLDRVDRVVSKLLTKHYSSLLTTREDFAADVQRVIEVLPGANPNEVFRLLQERENQANRIDLVVNFLQSRSVTRLARVETLPDDPALHRDPLYRDMRIVAKVLPDVNPNEIYAYLEAHNHQKNRIQLVIEELMRIVPTSTPSIGSSNASSLDDTVPMGKRIAYNIGDEVDELKGVFPDCDPTYLYNELEKRQDDKDRVKNLAWAMFENKDYPKYAEVMKEKEKLTIKERIENMTFDLKDFLSRFPDPCSTFEESNKLMGENYRQHVQAQIRNDFRELKTGFLLYITTKNKFHYTASKKEIQERIKDLPEESRKYKQVPRQEEPLPEEPDEFFFYEKMFVAHKDEILDHQEEEKKLKELKRLQAKENEELLECGCCYDDECLIEDMASCQDGHLFCKDCIKRSSEVAIGDGQCVFPCFTDNCDFQFPLPVLQAVMSPNMFSILLRRMQEEEVKQAAIPDLVSCPFCSFATIISNPNDKVFKCLNPECLKESCRLCKEPNHIPLGCNEIEKQGERNMRTYIETCVSEAMLRECHMCHRRFYKEYGCNKMTCTCGASQCYLCQKPVDDYDHFDDDDEEKCNLYSNPRELHIAEMRAAVAAGIEKYKAEHPEAADITLKYDAEKHIEELAAEFAEDEEYDPDGGDSEGDDNDDGSNPELSSDNDDNWRDDDDDEL
ncbi:uncharacterized protein LOC132558953 [Ylistrum balloti]|uniref:uncharacterized protein LOC132558953 n=1 Tax=Ylistrum balloti TaxID=509963 RepID=UPI002905C043|nr:uncharacterized protein LOC132558953 [Ylistrum balloti]